MVRIPNLLTLPQFAERHRAFSLGRLRHKAFHRATNGFERAFIRDRKRLYIDEERFFECLLAQQPGGLGLTGEARPGHHDGGQH